MIVVFIVACVVAGVLLQIPGPGEALAVAGFWVVIIGGFIRWRRMN